MIPNRASFRVESGPRSPRAPGSIASDGSRHSSNTSSEVTDARSESLRSMSRVSNPFVSRGTTKPRIPSSVCAQTTARSAMPPFVIHIFVPDRTQSSPSRRACVRMPLGSLPKSGSVKPKQPMSSPAAMGGSHRFFCSSVPYLQIGHIDSEPCTLTALRKPLSPASISRHVMP